MAVVPDLRVPRDARGRGPLFGRDVQGMPSEVGIFVPVGVLFPGTQPTEAALIETLKTLSRDDTLFHCARVNTIASGPGDFDIRGRQLRLLKTYGTPADIPKIDAFTREHPGAGLPMVFFRGQMLELMRWVARYCENHPGDGDTYKADEVRTQFVKAALIASEIWSKRIYYDSISAPGTVEALRLRALGPFRKAIEEAGLAPHLGVAFGRSQSLFGTYLPRAYPAFHAEFERATGLTFDDYMACTAGLATYVMVNSEHGPLFVADTVAASTTLRDVMPVYIALESQTPERLAQTFWDNVDTLGYRGLRERPIMLAHDGRAMTLDPTFLIERILAGPLFHLVENAERGKALQILGAFGNAFENYASDILRRMYPNRPGLIDRMAYNIRGRDAAKQDFEIDACLNDACEAAFFEIKASWLREDAVLNDDPDTLHNHLRDKYGIRPGTTGGGKGVAQLARSIGAVVRGEWLGDHGEFAALQRIYPVLLVHDGKLDAPLYGNFLEKEFRGLLGVVPKGKWVAPLTVMTINELEILESSVGAFSFCELLGDYARECPDRVRSLHNFIAYSKKYAPNIKPSAELIRSSAELLERVQRRLFPKPSEASG